MRTTKELSVLYAEDNEDSGFMLSTLLGLSGISVSLARTIKEAVRSAQLNEFDLYLLDSGFPDGSGVELCRQLGQINPKTPVVFYSGYASAADRQKGMNAGARAYLVKPEVDSVAPMIIQCVNASRKRTDKEANRKTKYAYARERTDVHPPLIYA